ncbi:SAM-dependent methyltransferase [Pseudonocardia sp. DSM 110487]|uniref:SAM-dependent methyltransferase n=1 Tax=Pseudonocardia sp. DSM 110487 TaxID=2865833 RepID=UPI001C6A7715|nr:SAM-dependent methyltransferase [Pseudonocardia sp. DSM 110487]QYN37860.1 SAM-dependent methyltransferase [Pseudonocardia sp. DSM 110487]
MTDAQSASDDVTARLNIEVPHSARVWNYWLGGKDNYAADRATGDKVRETYPGVVDVARQARAFLVRAVTYLAGECGVSQFLDVGTGLPTANNTHEVAQGVNPRARIVYVDNDPIVLAHARALLTSTNQGVCAYIDADVRDPGYILERAGRTLDFTQPVGLMMLGILGNISDYGQANAILKILLDGVPSGSYLVLNDGTNVIRPEAAAEAARIRAEAGDPYYLRTPEEITGFFSGLELLEPGVVSTSHWRPGHLWGEQLPPPVNSYCGVARKP